MCVKCLSNQQLREAHAAALRSYDLACLVAKADQGEFDFGLSEDDASIAATQFAVYSHEITAAGLGEKFGQPLTPGQLQAAAGRVAAQKAIGLQKLSAGARTALAPIYDQVDGALLDMVEGRVNPIQAAERMQALLSTAETAPGDFDPELYQPYQWARLCRTEASFADNVEQRRAYENEYDVDFSILEAEGMPPEHPNCLCGVDVIEHGGKFYAVLDLSPSACELCQDIADRVTEAVLAEAGVSP